jgi:hypothetical protein
MYTDGDMSDARTPAGPARPITNDHFPPGLSSWIVKVPVKPAGDQQTAR